MKFRSKTEAYTTAIFALNQINQKIKHSDIDSVIEKIKICIENHEQDPKVVIQHLKRLLDDKIIPTSEETHFQELMTAIETSPYDTQSAEERFANPLGRRFESEIALQLLLNPPDEMREVVGSISKEIINIIEDVQAKDKPASQQKLVEFLKYLQEKTDVIALGAFDYKTDLNEVIKILKENKPQDFIRIMFIHFIFAIKVFRNVPISTAPKNEPKGELFNIVKEQWKTGPPEEFFEKGISKDDADGNNYRSLISDGTFYKSKLYTAEGGRGRKGLLKNNYTNQLGLMLFEQKELAEGLPYHPNLWVADSKSQEANYKSQYVSDLIENDAIYVAGPSGMTSLFLGQMETIANLRTVEEKQIYLAAVVSYIAGGGFHSIHEIIGPAQYVLKLVPNYEVHVIGQTIPPAPNYHQFFEILEKNIPEFANLRTKAWENYLQFFAHQYYPQYIAGDKQLNKVDKASIDLQSVLLNTLAAYKKTLPESEEKFSLSFLSNISEKDRIDYSELLSGISKNNLEDQLLSLKIFFDKNAKIMNSNHPFFALFLNNLKENQQLVDAINNSVNNDPKFKPQPIDYQLSGAKRFRERAFTFFTSIELAKQPQIRM